MAPKASPRSGPGTLCLSIDDDADIRKGSFTINQTTAVLPESTASSRDRAMYAFLAKKQPKCASALKGARVMRYGQLLGKRTRSANTEGEGG